MTSTHTAATPHRFGQLVYLKAECLEEYKQCHAAVWPEVLQQIKDCNIEDYSIFFSSVPRPMLFAIYKYTGHDWAADMTRMAANPTVREWWEMTDKMQESPVPGAKGSASGPWWRTAEEVFYLE